MVFSFCSWRQRTGTESAHQRTLPLEEVLNEAYSSTGFQGICCDVILPCAYMGNQTTVVSCNSISFFFLTILLSPNGHTIVLTNVMAEVEKKHSPICSGLYKRMLATIGKECTQQKISMQHSNVDIF